MCYVNPHMSRRNKLNLEKKKKVPEVSIQIIILYKRARLGVQTVCIIVV